MITIAPPRKTESQIECLTVNCQEAAQLLGVSDRTLWELTKQGKVPCVRIGRKLRYSREMLRHYVNGTLNQEQ